jgi:phosphatidylserine/phosphatidylglycerophosphate/cardiolipin synthase-like enzyme
MPAKSTPTPNAIDQIIRKNLNRLRKPGVLTVRPGFEITKHQLTGKSAIVATVHTKKKGLTKNDLLPTTIGKIPVDVREATGYQRLCAHDPAAAELAQAYGRPEDQQPIWPLEREMPSGKLLDDPRSNVQRTMARAKIQQPATMQALAARAKKLQINYVPAPNAPLNPVIATTTITAHVSPDAGLVTLQAFLRMTKKSLVIGMYDFTSGPILASFENDLGGTKTLQMVLDNPPPNPTRDQTDSQTVQELDSSLGKRSKIVRALDRSDALVSAWMFPFAYHIKVIVRDNSVFWLSSGNLNNSNQPDLTSPPRTEDRDWHVIIEDDQLAKLFAAYLNQDFTSAAQHQLGQPTGVAAAVSDANAKLAADTNPPPPSAVKATTTSSFPAKVFNNISVKITPLLTPDKLVSDPTQGQYLNNILQLIAGAQHSLFIQLQYIEASNGTHDDFDTLLRAIAARVAAGVDVRLIESLQFGEKWAEKMKATGVDLTANISLQSDVHNKGFVVDGQTVVVSSQNFSPAGIRLNRDAGVIIESPDIANYFGPIFLSDWNNKATPFDPIAAAQLSKQRLGAKKTPPERAVRASAGPAQRARAKTTTTKRATVKRTTTRRKK